MVKDTQKKTVGLLALLFVYLLAAGAGLGVFLLLIEHVGMLLAVLIADVAATVLVWSCGLVLRTASVYDPYWSLQTIVIYVGLLAYYGNWNVHTIIPLIAIGLYSIRLTVNFLMGFHDLCYVDWRYQMLRGKSGRAFQFVNLMGICMFPTLIVYLASMPLFVYATLSSFSYWDIVGSGIVALGTLLELIADAQMKSFVKTRTSREETINAGLWRYSRHPNYLGEILIWVGAAFTLVLVRWEYWYYLAGAVAVFAMFLFISIPMEERHLKEYKPGYAQYIVTTSPLFLLPRREYSAKDEE